MPVMDSLGDCSSGSSSSNCISGGGLFYNGVVLSVSQPFDKCLWALHHWVSHLGDPH